MRRVPLALSAASATTLLLLTAVSCEDSPSGVELGEVGRADVVEVVAAPASVVASAAATLTAVAEGTLAELRVAPGDEVSEGDVLAVIDSPTAQARLAQAAEALAAAEEAVVTGPGTGGLTAAQDATDEAALAAFDQARAAAGHIADEELRAALVAQIDAAQEQYEAVAAAVREAVTAVTQGVAAIGDAVTALGTAQQVQAQQAYDLAEATVDALTLRAPLTGVVQLGGVAPAATADLTGLSDLSDLTGLLGAAGGAAGPPGAQPGVAPWVTPGSQVGAGTPVLTVVDVSELGLVAEVDETDVLLVEPGVEADVELDAALGARYPATVQAVDLLPTASARGGVAYGVHLLLDQGSWPDGTPAPQPRPGMSAVAHLRVREAAAALSVPAAAVLRVDGADVVWLVQDGRAVRTPVTLGVQGPELVQVTAGLSAGDRIVVRGADLVGEGDRLP